VPRLARRAAQQSQRQRLFIALALVNAPELVFLDELTTGLDPAARRVACGLIEALRRRGTTVVLVTHSMEEAERLCDRVAILRAGRVRTIGTPAEIVAAHGGRTILRFGDPRVPLDWLAELPHVAAVTRRGERVEAAGDGPVLPLVAAALVQRDIVPEDLRVEQPTLESAYLELTSGTA
jgi:ABC-2 type transport system ATP-binding protein